MGTFMEARHLAQQEINRRLANPDIEHYGKFVNDYSALTPPYIVVSTLRRHRETGSPSPHPTSRRDRQRWVIVYRVTVVVSGGDQELSHDEKLDAVDLVADVLVRDFGDPVVSSIMDLWDDNVDYTDYLVQSEETGAVLMRGGSFDLLVEVDFRK